MFYRSADEVLAVELRAGDGSGLVEPSTPRALLSGRFVRNERPAVAVYDVNDSGDEFLVIDPERRPTAMHVVTNWTDELERTMRSSQ